MFCDRWELCVILLATVYILWSYTSKQTQKWTIGGERFPQLLFKYPISECPSWSPRSTSHPRSLWVHTLGGSKWLLKHMGETDWALGSQIQPGLALVFQANEKWINEVEDLYFYHKWGYMNPHSHTHAHTRTIFILRHLNEFPTCSLGSTDYTAPGGPSSHQNCLRSRRNQTWGAALEASGGQAWQVLIPCSGKAAEALRA